VSGTSGGRRFGLTLKIFGATALVVAVVLGGTLAVVSAGATRSADEALGRRLDNTVAVADRFIEAENAKLASGALVAAQIPTFIAAVAKGGTNSLLDLASSYRDMLGASYTLITDNQAVLRARTDYPAEAGQVYDPPLIVQALLGHQGAGYVNQADRRLYLAVATPLKDLASGVVQGALLAAHQVTDSLAREVQGASGSEIVFYLLDTLNHPVVVATTVPRSARLDQAVTAAVGAVGDGGGRDIEARLDGDRFVGRNRLLQNQGSRSPLGGYLALRSRDEELAAFRRTQRTLLFAGIAGLLLALAGSWVVARVIGRPVRTLVGATRRVAAGDYDARVEVATRDEIGELASAFRRMVEELKAKQQLVELLTSGPQAATLPMDTGESGVVPAAARREGGGTSGMLQAGTTFAGRYEIKSILGMGGMGVVYRAWDTQLGDTVAIKTLRTDAMQAEPAALERFKQEIRLARKITHRNVVRTHDIGEVDGLHFITMEFVEGQSLKHLIQARGSLPVNVVLTVGKQLCRALEVAHEQGVIHRDIKPQNLIVEPSGTLKVMDFGIARLATRTRGMTQAGMAIGTPEYMAPEQLMGEEVDFRVDLYATGVVLFESLTGRPPFIAESPVTLVAKQLEESPPSPSDLNREVPKRLAALVLRTLSKDPAGRPQSATELFEALDGIAA
jgi:HAMP domain-containing protein/predicted Ser/Thr protein kinase